MFDHFAQTQYKSYSKWNHRILINTKPENVSIFKRTLTFSSFQKMLFSQISRCSKFLSLKKIVQFLDFSKRQKFQKWISNFEKKFLHRPRKQSGIFFQESCGGRLDVFIHLRAKIDPNAFNFGSRKKPILKKARTFWRNPHSRVRRLWKKFVKVQQGGSKLVFSKRRSPPMGTAEMGHGRTHPPTANGQICTPDEIINWCKNIEGYKAVYYYTQKNMDNNYFLPCTQTMVLNINFLICYRRQF